jgi:hypothetical protein
MVHPLSRMMTDIWKAFPTKPEQLHLNGMDYRIREEGGFRSETQASVFQREMFPCRQPAEGSACVLFLAVAHAGAGLKGRAGRVGRRHQINEMPFAWLHAVGAGCLGEHGHGCGKVQLPGP